LHRRFLLRAWESHDRTTEVHIMLKLVSAAALLVAAGCAPAEAPAETAMAPAAPPAAEAPPAATAPMQKDIVDTAVGAGSFNTLVAAVQAAGLESTLRGSGPFTVFAPTDAAFAALPAGTVEDLLKPENKDKLTAILTYHVLPAEVMSSAVAGKTTDAATVQGAPVKVVGGADGTVTVNDAKVVTADVDASNGVIHVIDKVIMPPT
jgi:uncharacterized surface protein with fasciclin (FAS1) repeats